MSTNWVKDIAELHDRFGVNIAVDNMDNAKLREYLEFRVKFLEEEMAELRAAMNDPEEIVDALIDLCVVAIGTLDAFAINPYEAWDEVHKANMAKVPGVKETRPNPLGLPDLIKPEGWQPPSHAYNHGYLFMMDKS